MGQKKLLEMHIAAYKLIIAILNNVLLPDRKFKEAYMIPCPPHETEADVPSNRMLFREYLRQLALSRKAFLGIPYE